MSEHLPSLKTGPLVGVVLGPDGGRFRLIVALCGFLESLICTLCCPQVRPCCGVEFLSDATGTLAIQNAIAWADVLAA